MPLYFSHRSKFPTGVILIPHKETSLKVLVVLGCG